MTLHRPPPAIGSADAGLKVPLPAIQTFRARDHLARQLQRILYGRPKRQDPVLVTEHCDHARIARNLLRRKIQRVRKLRSPAGGRSRRAGQIEIPRMPPHHPAMPVNHRLHPRFTPVKRRMAERLRRRLREAHAPKRVMLQITAFAKGAIVRGQRCKPARPAPRDQKRVFRPARPAQRKVTERITHVSRRIVAHDPPFTTALPRPQKPIPQLRPAIEPAFAMMTRKLNDPRTHARHLAPCSPPPQPPKMRRESGRRED